MRCAAVPTTPPTIPNSEEATMKSGPGLTRRRFVTIAAAAAGLPLLPPLLHASHGRAAAPIYTWRGAMLGADACIQLHHPNADTARRLIEACVAEAARLEKIFSLYRADSAVVRLNRQGELRDPPADLVRLLSEAGRFS